MANEDFEYINGRKVYYWEIKDVRFSKNAFGYAIFFLTLAAIIANFYNPYAWGLGTTLSNVFEGLLIFVFGSGLATVIGGGVKIDIDGEKPVFIYTFLNIGNQKLIDRYKTLAERHKDD